MFPWNDDLGAKIWPLEMDTDAPAAVIDLAHKNYSDTWI